MRAQGVPTDGGLTQIVVGQGFVGTSADDCRHAWIFTVAEAECGMCGIGEAWALTTHGRR